jgi:Zn-dependent protease with chaperone function
VTAAVLLTGYVMAAGYLTPAALRGGGWAARAPRLAISVWAVLSASWIIAAALSIYVIAAPPLTWPATRAAARMPVHHAPGTSALLGSVLAGAVLTWAGICVAGELTHNRRERRTHLNRLHATGRPDQLLDATIVDHEVPTAYCLPGASHRIVVSTAALAVLDTVQVRAVLAHERAHLRGKHHLVLSIAAALSRAFPYVPLFGQAKQHLAVLAEMAADDAAARHHDPADLAKALVILATANVASPALTAGGPAATARIQRLLAPHPTPTLPARMTKLVAGAAAVAGPIGVCCLPLIALACDLAGR